MNRWMLPALAGLALLAVVPAEAEMEGPCSLEVDGVDVRAHDADAAGDAIRVKANEDIDFVARAPAAIATWEIFLHYGPTTFVVDQGSNDLPVTPTLEDEQVGAMNVGDYAWAGVGLYQATARLTLHYGTECNGAFLVDLQGNPLVTAMGAGAAAVGVLGGGTLIAAAVSGLSTGKEALDAAKDMLGGLRVGRHVD